LFKQGSEGSSASTNFQTGIRFSSWSKMFEAHGTCGDHGVMCSSLSGPPITIRTSHNVTRVQELVSRNLSKSLQWSSQELGISVSSVRCMLVKDLQLYPYWIQITVKKGWQKSFFIYSKWYAN